MTLPEQPPVLRDRVAAALALRTTPATAQQLADELLPPTPSAYRQTHRALAQLEQQGRAHRERGQWTATT